MTRPASKLQRAVHLALAALAISSPCRAYTVLSVPEEGNSSALAPDADGKYWIYGDGLAAAFVPYGASIANLLFRDRRGVERDLVAGFDNASYYSVDKQHPHFDGVPGRYANHIKNSSFSIDGRLYHVAANENPTAEKPQGVDTLYGGPDGWDWRNFSVEAHTRDSITFALYDPPGKEGFPGAVQSRVSYALRGQDWYIKMTAEALTEKTPIMLSSHTYWNLDEFANEETNTALNHSLWLPFSGQRIGVDNILIPTGDILTNHKGSVNDFWSAPKQLGASLTDPALEGNCGFNCTGYDNCYTITRDPSHLEAPVAVLASPWSGIQLSIRTNQAAMQVHSCNGQNGTIALKKTQGVGGYEADKNFPRTIPKYGCVVLEVQDYIDGINNPEWMRKQVYGPMDDSYVLQAKYSFSLMGERGGGGRAVDKSLRISFSCILFRSS